jgi:hypothetical protein
MGYRAAASASAAPFPEGNIGAGSGASVGKIFGAALAAGSADDREAYPEGKQSPYRPGDCFASLAMTSWAGHGLRSQ